VRPCHQCVEQERIGPVRSGCQVGASPARLRTPEHVSVQRRPLTKAERRTFGAIVRRLKVEECARRRMGSENRIGCLAQVALNRAAPAHALVAAGILTFFKQAGCRAFRRVGKDLRDERACLMVKVANPKTFLRTHTGAKGPLASTFFGNWHTAIAETQTVGCIPKASAGSRRLGLVRRLRRPNQEETGNQGSTAVRA
jgi:hypothetical protein